MWYQTRTHNGYRWVYIPNDWTTAYLTGHWVCCILPSAAPDQVFQIHDINNRTTDPWCAGHLLIPLPCTRGIYGNRLKIIITSNRQLVSTQGVPMTGTPFFLHKYYICCTTSRSPQRPSISNIASNKASCHYPIPYTTYGTGRNWII